MYDAIIVGGGPAGMNAALVLGRCQRSVLLCDLGKPRNAVSRGVNGFITRDGALPSELREIGRAELARYPSVEIREVGVEDVEFALDGFDAILSDGTRERSRRMLLATGVADSMPDIPGFAELYGHGVFNCPYCDGWEQRGRRFVVYGQHNNGVNFSLQLKRWSDDVILCTDGPCGISDDERGLLERNGVTIREEEIARLEGDSETLSAVHFQTGETLPRDALFFITGAQLNCGLATKLGCELTEKGVVRTVGNEKTNVPGLFVAGDASQRAQFAVVAAAEGALAALEINNQLTREDLK
ncbi:NAD(P)/FAD-dependent oxidoreductase [Terrihabitans sp. B22-R8]|uniref:NAD(P)/FAD-dependent oxidoreductase n=1 Tax=Terrihabitans sp. B22-R8 TaxID=3425128 RepID=UPI00403D1211